MPRISKNYKLLDPVTGEIIPIDITFRKVGQGGRFMKLWQDTTLEFIKKHPEIRGFSLRILLYLIAKADWNNAIPPPSSASLELKLPETSCYRAYSELAKANFLSKRGGSYSLSPLFCWKGNDQQYEVACRQLTQSSLPQLTDRYPSGVASLSQRAI